MFEKTVTRTVLAAGVAVVLAGIRVSAAAALPPGIEPTTVSLSSVLAAYRRASGTVAPGRPDTRVLRWTIAIGGMTGTETALQSGSDERTDTILGPAHEAAGTLGGRGWSMNANGEVVMERGIHRGEQVDDATFRAATGPSSAIVLVGHMTEPFDAYVIKVDPTGGVLEYLYIDRATSLLDARAIHRHGHSDLVTYDDYRTTLGVTTAWHAQDSIDDGRQVEDYRLQDIALGVPVDPSQLAIPQSKSIVAFSAPRSTLPGRIIGDRIILPIKIGGRVVNLQLDSGAAGIALDRGVVEALGYTEYGRVIGETAGTYVESDAVIPSMTLGTLTMQNVHVRAIPFGDLANGDTPVAGLLGFDFIDSVVLHIDYVNGSVEAIDPQAFTPPPAAVSIPIALDDEIPAISARIGPATGLRFLVDTGADRSILFPSFASAHADALVDHGLGAEMEASFPFLSDFEGVGGEVSYRPIELGPLTVAPWTYEKWLFFLTQDASKFELDDYDGILGQDLLRYYDLYLDYPHSRILLVPNSRYTDRFGN
jgi:hypothetical protein